MNQLSVLLSTIRGKGLSHALRSGLTYLRNLREEHKLRRWYRNGHAQNRQFDIRNGVETYSAVEVSDIDVDEQVKSESNRFQSIYEQLFAEAFQHLQINHSEYKFLDIGSGKGKAMLLASRYRFNRIIGVEYSKDLCRICKRNLEVFHAAWQSTKSFEVICADARQYELPKEPLVIFFFNPFRGALMQAVVERLNSTLRDHPRPVWVVYCNPDCAEYFDAIPTLRPVAHGRRFRVWKTQDS